MLDVTTTHPAPPSSLSARGKHIWWHVAMDHAVAGETERLNSPLIGEYCQLAADYLAARDQVRRQGLTCLSRRGNLTAQHRRATNARALRPAYRHRRTSSPDGQRGD